jgi:hypothetical protein
MYVECYSHPWREQAITTIFNSYARSNNMVIKKTRANEIERLFLEL